MLQEVTIKTQDAKKLKPLLRSAIEREVKLLEHAIHRTRQAMEPYEDRYQMKSADFERGFKSGEIEETLDYLDWWMELEALHHLEEQYRSLVEAQFD